MCNLLAYAKDSGDEVMHFFGVILAVGMVLFLIVMMLKILFGKSSSEPDFTFRKEVFTKDASKEEDESEQLEKCENCKRVIGKLEKPYVFKDHVVCAECYKRLKSQE